MQESKIFLVFVLAMAILSACSKKELNPTEYMNWVRENSNVLSKVVEVGDVKYTAILRTPEYNIAKSYIEKDTMLRNNTQKGTIAIVLKMEPLDGKTQVLTIGANRKEEPFERINYYMNGVAEDIQLFEGNDTLRIASFLYERYYNLSPSQNLVSGFICKKQLGETDLVYEIDDQALKYGKIRFEFEKSLLGDLPKLKIN